MANNMHSVNLGTDTVNTPIPFALNYRVSAADIAHILSWASGNTAVQAWLEGFLTDMKDGIGSIKVFPFDTAYVPAENMPVWLMGSTVEVDGSDMIRPAFRVDVYQGIKYEYELSRLYNDFRDFEPYSSYSIYLPFCGTFPLPTANIIAGVGVPMTISVDYSIDLNTGSGNAFVYSNGVLLMSKPCSVAVPVFWNASNIGDTTRTLATQMLSTAISAGTQAGMGGQASDIVSGVISDASSSFMWGVSNMGKIPVVQGAMSGAKDMFSAPSSPFIIRTSPRSIDVLNYDSIIGKATWETKVLGDIPAGDVAVVSECHLENFNGATSSEIGTIEQLLKTGVIM